MYLNATTPIIDDFVICILYFRLLFYSFLSYTTKPQTYCSYYWTKFFHLPSPPLCPSLLLRDLPFFPLAPSFFSVLPSLSVLLSLSVLPSLSVPLSLSVLPSLYVLPYTFSPLKYCLNTRILGSLLPIAQAYVSCYKIDRVQSYSELQKSLQLLQPIPGNLDNRIEKSLLMKKELNIRHKFECSYPFIFATLSSIPSGCKDLRVRISEFVAIFQFFFVVRVLYYVKVYIFHKINRKQEHSALIRKKHCHWW